MQGFTNAKRAIVTALPSIGQSLWRKPVDFLIPGTLLNRRNLGIRHFATEEPEIVKVELGDSYERNCTPPTSNPKARYEK